MKQIDFSETGICDVQWSLDGEWLTYVRNGDEICKARAEGGEPIVVTKGVSPCFNSAGNILFERSDEIYLHSQGSDSILIGKNDIEKGTPKRKPKSSPDGKMFTFVIDNVSHRESEAKNAYPFRSFLGVAAAEKRPAAKMLAEQQWYGGTVTWFSNSSNFLHYEFDSTGGARIHLTNLSGEKLGTIFGLFPSISPDEKRIACKPKGGQSVVVYVSRNEQWDMDDVDTTVSKLPEGGRLSGSPPVWLDNRFVLIDEGGKVFRVDTRKQEAEEFKNVPTPALRGTHTMVASPGRDRVAVEIDTGSGFELQVISL